MTMWSGACWTKGLCRCFDMSSLSLSLSCDCSFAHVPSQLGHTFRQVIVLEQNGRSHIMSSSANDNLTSIYTGSDGICNSDYDCNSEDVQLENQPGNKGRSGFCRNIKWFWSGVMCIRFGWLNYRSGVMSAQDIIRGIKEIQIQDDGWRFGRNSNQDHFVHKGAIPSTNGNYQNSEGRFYVPNRAQLMLDLIQKHGDRVVKEISKSKKRFKHSTRCIHPQQARGNDDH